LSAAALAEVDAELLKFEGRFISGCRLPPLQIRKLWKKCRLLVWLEQLIFVNYKNEFSE